MVEVYLREKHAAMKYVLSQLSFQDDDIYESFFETVCMVQVGSSERRLPILGVASPGECA
jgi:hypothetical protein